MDEMRGVRGFTLLFRHADKMRDPADRTEPTTEIQRSRCLDFDERLNNHGVKQAQDIQDAFAELTREFGFRIHIFINSFDDQLNIR